MHVHNGENIKYKFNIRSCDRYVDWMKDVNEM